MDEPSPQLMHRLLPSRARPMVGDIFKVEFDSGLLAGRVIRTDALVVEGAPGLNLLYFFRDLTSRAQDMKSMGLTIDKLLIPPVLTNNLGWTRGYFQTVGNRRLGPGEVLDQHCFDAYGRGYFNEYGHPMPEPIQPVGLRGVHSYLTIEHELSVALGWGGTLSE